MRRRVNTSLQRLRSGFRSECRMRAPQQRSTSKQLRSPRRLITICLIAFLTFDAATARRRQSRSASAVEAPPDTASSSSASSPIWHRRRLSTCRCRCPSRSIGRGSRPRCRLLWPRRSTIVLPSAAFVGFPQMKRRPNVRPSSDIAGSWSRAILIGRCLTP